MIHLASDQVYAWGANKKKVAAADKQSGMAATVMEMDFATEKAARLLSLRYEVLSRGVVIYCSFFAVAVSAAALDRKFIEESRRSGCGARSRNHDQCQLRRRKGVGAANDPARRQCTRMAGHLLSLISVLCV